MTSRGALQTVLCQVIGVERTRKLLNVLTIPEALLKESDRQISRAALAQALNMLLFEDLLERVPDGKRYVDDCLRDGKKVMHDHGAVRTVALRGMGKLPSGESAITRILRPLGYAFSESYPLDRLKMVGRSHVHREYPEEIAQFFISELYPDRFSQDFQQAVRRVTDPSVDPLTSDAAAQLREVADTGSLSIEKAILLLPILLTCFSRQHEEVALSDYEKLLAESPEMAWIATEGNSFNHATDRVADVDRLTEEQNTLGRPMKAVVETSRSGRVRQTAFLAARVMRNFRDVNGTWVTKEVPGSFYEFITREQKQLDDGRTVLDLSFDSSNAQAIFKMTATTSA